MGRKKQESQQQDADSSQDIIETPPPKKTKKSKKTKKQVKVEYDDDSCPDDSMDMMVEGMDIEIDEKPSSTDLALASDKLKAQILASTSAGVKGSPTTGKSSGKKRKGVRRDSGTSSGEERWLDAIESGKLEEVDDELKKIKDPKLMTARQRAMYEQRTNTVSENDQFVETLMALPTGYKEKVMTVEAMEKAQIKSLKRKQLADEKREKEKKKTMERLLKKSDSKFTKNPKQPRSNRATVPMISYRNTVDGITLSFPPNTPIPLKPQLAVSPPEPKLCAVPGCGNAKRYNCSKTNVPLCSFKCYRANVTSSIKQIFC